MPSPWKALPRWLRIAIVILVAVPSATLTCFSRAAARRERLSNTAAAPSSGRFVQTADAAMFVQEDGPSDGPPVVLIHGTGAWSEIWRGTMRSLAARGYHAVALDMPPFGYSSRPAIPNFSDDAQGRRILGVLEALRLEHVTLVGHSFGARPTMQAAFLAPARVSAVVLVDAALGLDTTLESSGPGPATRVLLAVKPLRDPLVAATLTNPAMTRRLLMRLIAETSAATPERVQMLQQPFVVEGTTERFGEWLRPFVTTNELSLATRRASYASLKVPALVIWGALDSLTPLEQGRDLARLIPGASLTELPRAGHIPAIEDPSGFDQALLLFLDANVSHSATGMPRTRR
ncbi:MAG TPA: alpha/beta fold hydrolase [Gemmatimonadaceae bacterium]|nr:alpha/beta fold hydrolase [Gemmatimonadaceae bacterium]